MGYAEAANLAVNQTLVRSINTSIVALLPVGAILYVGAVQLGSGSLKDLALALFVGMAAGLYSSVFIATPLLAHMKAGETAVQQAERRARARQRAMADRYHAVPASPSGAPAGDARPAPRVRGRRAGRGTRRPAPRPQDAVGWHRPRTVRSRRAARPVATSPRASHARSGDRSERRRRSGARRPRPPGRRRPGLPRARRGLQGHQSAAGRPRRVHRRDRGPGRGRP